MILTCPSCSTRYFADAATLGPKGRSVRCAACGHIWQAFAEDDANDRDAATSVDPLDHLEENAPASVAKPTARRTAVDELRAKRHRRSRRARAYVAAGAWSGVAATFLVVLGLAYAFRVDVVRIWPQTASAYAAVGLDTTARGLVFERLVAERSFENGEPVLQISATVRNVTGRELPVPYVRVSLRDAGRGEVFGWTVALEADSLAGHGSTRFTTRVARPPLDAQDMELRFIDEPQGRVTPAAAAGGEAARAGDADLEAAHDEAADDETALDESAHDEGEPHR